MDDKQILLGDPDTIILKSPYDEAEVRATKRIPGAKWDKMQRVWKFPMSSIHQVLAFAEEFGHWVDPSLTTTELPEHPIGPERIEITENLEVYFPYDSVRVTAMRKIPGAVWNKTRWVVPFRSVAEVLEFAATFKIAIPDDRKEELEMIQAGVRSEAVEREMMSKAEEHDLEVENFHGELKPFQKAGVAYALRTRKCFIADEMGLGKTVEAIAALEAAGEFPVVVVCPPSLLLNWAMEIRRFTPHRTVALVRNRSEFPDEEYDYVILGDSNLTTWAGRLGGHKSYVFDESHRFKNYDAKRTKAAIKIAKGADGLVLNLTGTPIINRPAEYASQIDILGLLKEFGGKWPFYKRYANAYQDRFGQWDISGASHLEELNQRLRGLCYIRRTKEQVLKELLPERRERLYVEGERKIMVEYAKAEADIASFVAERAAAIARELGKSPYSAAVRARIRAEAAEHLVRISALRRLAALAKLPAVFEWIDAHIENGLKVVVAAHHRDVVDAVANRYGNIKIQGQMDVERVELNKYKFQFEDAQVMALSIDAAGLGHTLTAAQDIAIVELPWTPGAVDQTVARLHRMGQEGSVLATFFLAEGTIDFKMMKLLEDKEQIVKAATEGGEFEKSGGIAGELLLSYL